MLFQSTISIQYLVHTHSTAVTCNIKMYGPLFLYKIWYMPASFCSFYLYYFGKEQLDGQNECVHLSLRYRLRIVQCYGFLYSYFIFLCNLMLKQQKYSCACCYCCAKGIFNFKLIRRVGLLFFDSVICVFFLHLMNCLQIL